MGDISRQREQNGQRLGGMRKHFPFENWERHRYSLPGDKEQEKAGARS